LDAGFTFNNLVFVEIVKFYRLLQSKDMFRSPVAF
jgi:hypothetical protein